MVSIGKINWLTQGASKVGQTQAPSSGVRFGGENGQQGGNNNLQDRLSAIDKGDPTAFLSLTGTPKISAISGSQNSNNGSLMSRLDAIGTGELSPNYYEKDFDFKA